MILVTRKKTWEMFEKNWCPVCGKVTEMQPMQTNLPGIMAQKCPAEHFFQANFLEDENDTIALPNNFILMP
jgi:hypothetical protein